jgi:DNA-binding transcriptional ArsR family regulator
VIEIIVEPADLTKIRFSGSLMAEIQASLHGLRHPYKNGLHAGLARYLPAPAPAELELLLDTFAPGDWVPDTLLPAPREGQTVADQLGSVATMDLSVVQADLAYLRNTGAARWQTMSAERFRSELAEAVTWYWDAVMQPLWPRVESIVKSELAYRANVITSSGVAAALSDISPYFSLRVGALAISGHSHDGTYQVGGRGIWLLPTVFRWPRLSLSVAHGIPIVSYGARGAAKVWETFPEQGDALGHLLGHTRSRIIQALELPVTTTALAAALRLAPGTVSQHLAVLEAAGLVVSRRDGRQVWYQHTEVVSLLFNAAGRSTWRRGRRLSSDHPGRRH